MSVNKFGQSLAINNQQSSSPQQRLLHSIIQFTPEGHASFGNIKFVSSITPTEEEDIVNKGYVDFGIKTLRRYVNSLYSRYSSNMEEKYKEVKAHFNNALMVQQTNINKNFAENLKHTESVIQALSNQTVETLAKQDVEINRNISKISSQLDANNTNLRDAINGLVENVKKLNESLDNLKKQISALENTTATTHDEIHQVSNALQQQIIEIRNRIYTTIPPPSQDNANR